ncbi:MAG: hypothetical protein HFH67_15300 [Lachnospiraceae bacterium]|nr:hypothetical protein [Lachnospiraceae bacterium]
MKKIYCIVLQIVLLAWFFLDMTGFYFGGHCLVIQSYNDDGIFFLIYFAAVILFITQEKTGKWFVAIFTALWFITQFICHEWYTIFNGGFMGGLEGKIKHFQGTIHWTAVEGRYIPDVYHTILHILILSVFASTVIYIHNTRNQNNIAA